MKHNLFSRFTSVLLAVVLLAGVMSTPILATDSGVPAETPAVVTEQTEQTPADSTAPEKYSGRDRRAQRGADRGTHCGADGGTYCGTLCGTDRGAFC